LSQSDHPTFGIFKGEFAHAVELVFHGHRDLDAVLLHFREEIFYPFDFDKQSEAAAHAFGATWLIRPIPEQASQAEENCEAVQADHEARLIGASCSGEGAHYVSGLEGPSTLKWAADAEFVGEPSQTEKLEGFRDCMLARLR
jgi:hypothetical protein